MSNEEDPVQHAVDCGITFSGEQIKFLRHHIRNALVPLVSIQTLEHLDKQQQEWLARSVKRLQDLLRVT